MKPQVKDFVRHKKLQEWAGKVYQVRRNMVTVIVEECGTKVSSPAHHWEVVSKASRKPANESRAVKAVVSGMTPPLTLIAVKVRPWCDSFWVADLCFNLALELLWDLGESLRSESLLDLISRLDTIIFCDDYVNGNVDSILELGK